MEAIATAAPAATAQPNAQVRPRLLDQHYYLVNGRDYAPVGLGKSTGDNWGEYYDELHKLYDEAAAQVAGTEQVATFDEWAKTHVHFVSGQTAVAASYEIEQSLPQNTDPGDIHMLGTSAGGAGIFEYLSRVLR